MKEDVSEKELLRFLETPKSYPHQPPRVWMIQTHSSWVALAAPFVYKVKKPVNFGFLDFSTLEKRKFFCEREVELNRRLCPGVHLGVLPISRKKGRLTFGAGEAVVEYAVHMRKLPERYFILRCLERQAVGTAEIDRIVSTLKAFYEAQHPDPEIARWGRKTKLKISTDENFRQTEDFIGNTISRPAYEAIRAFTNGFFRQHPARFAARVLEGRIRDCHGDLHLEHIHLSPKHVVIFDCIEFNDRFRYIDVANDVAFLAMDFDFRRRPDLSRYTARRIAAQLSDPGLLGLLDFYKCYRAYVRGKVESFQLLSGGITGSEKREIGERAHRYFRLALRYAVSGSQPMVLIASGRVGSGKSTLARSLGEELGWRVYSSDRIRKELAGVSLYVRGGQRERRRLYSKAMTDRTYAALERAAEAEIAKRRGVILDATFSSRRRRSRLRHALERFGVDFCFLESRARPETIKRRLAARSRSTGEISDARLEDYAMLDRAYEPPSEVGPGHLIGVRTARTSEAVVTAALKGLARRRARE